MPARARPEGCCPLKPVRALSRRRRERIVSVFKALADPTRLELVRLLAAQPGPTCVCDLVDRFELSQPTISHHLKILREAGLVRATRIGIWSFYEVDPGGLDPAGELMPRLASPAGRRRPGSAPGSPPPP